MKVLWYCQYHKRYHTSMTKRYTTKGWRIRSNTNEPLMCEKGLKESVLKRKDKEQSERVKVKHIELDYENGKLKINGKEVDKELIVLLIDDVPEYPRKKIIKGLSIKKERPVITVDISAITGADLVDYIIQEINKKTMADGKTPLLM